MTASNTERALTKALEDYKARHAETAQKLSAALMLASDQVRKAQHNIAEMQARIDILLASKVNDG